MESAERLSMDGFEAGCLRLPASLFEKNVASPDRDKPVTRRLSGAGYFRISQKIKTAARSEDAPSGGNDAETC